MFCRMKLQKKEKEFLRMTSQTAFNTGVAVGTQGKSQTLKSFKQKHFKPKTTLKKKPEILWHHDLNGNHFNYHPKIANTFGLLAAMILEYMRYWCRYNAQKKDDYRAYSVYKTGIELAILFSVSRATLWRVIGLLQKEGFIEFDKSKNHYGKINVYRLTKKYFDFVGLTTITRLEREIFFPNKEDVISQKSNQPFDRSEQKIDPNLSETREEKITLETEAKIEGKSHHVMVGFLDNLYLIVRQCLSHLKGNFSQIDAGYSEKSYPLNIQMYKKDPLTPHQNNSDPSDFLESQEESVFNETENLKTRFVEDQENIKTQPAKKRQPNERKKPLQASCKVKAPARIEALEGFEALHGFPSSLCREKHEEFYTAYPKKADKEASYRAFVKVLFLLEISFGDLMKKVSVFKDFEDVQKRMGVEGGRYIKHPANWLWNKSWVDIALPENPHRQQDVEKNTVQSFVNAQNAEIQPFLTHLCALIGEAAFLSWFTSLAYTLSGQELVMECQSKFREEKIRLKFDQWMAMALQKASLENVRISFIIAKTSPVSSGQEGNGEMEQRGEDKRFLKRYP